jgi:hypothetical protein
MGLADKKPVRFGPDSGRRVFQHGVRRSGKKPARSSIPLNWPHGVAARKGSAERDESELNALVSHALKLTLCNCSRSRVGLAIKPSGHWPVLALTRATQANLWLM